MQLKQILKSTITTNDCKKFLAEFFAKNPLMISGMYKEPDFLASAKVESQWKRLWKYGPRSEFVKDNEGELEIYPDVCTNPKGWFYEKTNIFTTNLASVRLFVCNPIELDSALQFLVLEDINGKLYLGTNYSD